MSLNLEDVFPVIFMVVMRSVRVGQLHSANSRCPQRVSESDTSLASRVAHTLTCRIRTSVDWNRPKGERRAYCVLGINIKESKPSGRPHEFPFNAHKKNTSRYFHFQNQILVPQQPPLSIALHPLNGGTCGTGMHLEVVDHLEDSQDSGTDCSTYADAYEAVGLCVRR